MTLEEAIKHAEELAEINQAIAYNTDDDNWIDIAQCEKCAEEHRQLAKWLRELKAYRERMPSYEAGYNDAKREIALSGEYKRAYDRGYEQACKDKIDIPYKEVQDAERVCGTETVSTVRSSGQDHMDCRMQSGNCPGDPASIRREAYMVHQMRLWDGNGRNCAGR